MYSLKKLTPNIRDIAQKIYDDRKVCKISMTTQLGKYYLIKYYWSGSNEVTSISEDDYKYLLYDYFPKLRKNKPILISQEYIITTESLPIPKL